MEEATTTATPTFVVAGGNYWGQGKTLAEAKRNFTRYGGTLSGGYVTLEFDPETEFKGVDGMGRYHWVGNAPVETEVPPRSKKSGVR